MKENAIEIQTTIKESIGNVWEKWNNPEHITKWYFASEDWCAPKAENTLKVGGRLNIRMEAKDGSFGFDYYGDYTKVTTNALLEYTLGDALDVRVTFVEKNGGTIVTEVFDIESQNSAELQKQGWSAILDNFRKYCEGQ